jgi:hypothetical protein
MAQKAVFDRVPHPLITFSQEEMTLRRPLGGKMVLRRQLEHLLGVAEMRHVEIQVMPTRGEDHAAVMGSFRLLKLQDRTAVGHTESQLYDRVISDPKDRRCLVRVPGVHGRTLTSANLSSAPGSSSRTRATSARASSGRPMTVCSTARRHRAQT